MSRGPWKCRTLPEHEKYIQHRIMGMYRAVGFKVFNLSQARATNQSPGLPDLLVMHPVLKVEATHEVKSPAGRLSPPQRLFAELRAACGRRHLIGGQAVAEAWLLELGLMRELPGGQRILVPKLVA